MTRPLLAPLAAALLALGATAPAPAAPLPARALVDSVAARYAGLQAYRFEGTTRNIVSGGQLPAPMSMDARFAYAARGPSQVRFTTDGPGMSSTLVSDGESLWVFMPERRQYQVRRAPHPDPAADPASTRLGALEPLMTLVTLNRGLAGVEESGADTLPLASGATPCRRLVLSYPPDTAAGAPRMQPRVVWVDPVRRLVVRDSITVEFDDPRAGHVRRMQVMDFERLEPDQGGPDSLYSFAPPAGAQRVRQFGDAAPGSRLVGQPAPGFTLPALAGAGVSLAGLRGKVVVLDFWATWCGPCRRWMPIVAKIEKQVHDPNVRFYAVNVAESPAAVRKFLRTAGTTPPVLLDADGKVSGLYGAASIPLTVVIGRDGKVVDALLGLHPEEDLVEALRTAGVKGI